MAANLLPYALTTLQRVKDRIFDTNVSGTQPTAFDDVITRMINGATDWIERETGNRRFVLTKYTNEIYSAYGPKQKRLILRQAPVFFTTQSGNTTISSTSITSVTGTAGMVVGMPIMADNFPPGTTIASISGATVTASAAATSTVVGSYFQVNGLVDFQWRAGTPSNPNWIDFIIDQYELINDGKAGVIRIYGVLPRLYNNMARVTYYAGYPVDWANAGNGTTHQLPSDLTDMVENLVVRRFKRRVLAGRGSESLDGATTSWNRDLDADDIDVIGHYRRLSTIF